ncbi:TPA: sodium/proline symporter [Candidatus Marinimicrobia bacterium]|nr:sodium/proline symporter [Candidatus Neomarinimicrobiota bacterium]HBY17614.1 sodium/proline symporter [Candidatus Neomarinimicrobiota bacterium]
MVNQSQIILVMIIYLTLLIGWGIWQGRQVKSQKDYAIAGRNLPGWVAALSERATGESSWALLGLPGFAYATGLTSIWTAIGCVSGIIVAWWLIAFRLREEAEKYDVNSFTEFIARRHGAMEKPIRIVSSLVIVFFFFFYVGAQFLGGGKTLNAMFGIEPSLGMLLTACIIVPYTVYGGFRSVVYTDVIQAIVMIITLIVGPLVGLLYLKNHPDLFAGSLSEALYLAGNSYSSITNGVSGFAAGIAIMGGFSWFFGYLGGQPQLSMRFMAIKDKKQARKARNVGVIWTLFAYLGALSIGWIGIAVFGPQGLSDPETVMPNVMLTVFPPVFAAILITGAIAAMISTADSLLILSATELSENILKQQAKNSLGYSRGITAILAVVALLLAYYTPSNLIYTLVGYVWAGIGGTFSVIILLTLFWKRFHGKAVVITIISGMLFTIIWISSGMENRITSRFLTFFVALIVAVISTLVLDRKRGNAIVEA